MNFLDSKLDKKQVLQRVAIGTAAGVAVFAAIRYRTSRSHEYLVRTGLGIESMQIRKKCVQWPFQNIDRLSMVPRSIRFSVNSMSREKMEFTLPAVFTIGPRKDHASLEKYATFLLNQSNSDTENMIRGIIEGETRALAANLAIEDIFAGRTAFKDDMVSNVEKQLEQYGLHICNANIEELKDSQNSNYFVSLSKRIQSEAENRARVEVSEQNKIGTIGENERQAETRKQTAIIEAETTLVENERQQEILKSKAALEKLKAEQEFIIKQSVIKATNDAEIFDYEQRKRVEESRNTMEIEKMRATALSETKVKAEMQIQQAEAEKTAKCLLADAELYAEQQKAAGIRAVYEARSAGIQQMVTALGGNTQAYITTAMLESQTFEKLAQANASAIQGLNPNITVWTNDGNNSMDTIQALGKAIIPTLDTIQKQTGYSLPNWLLKKTEVGAKQIEPKNV